MELIRTQSAPETCSYLPEETSSLDYRYIIDIEARDYQELLSRGWRRFGFTFFRPACPACVKCQSLRIDTSAFKASKSQRRNLKRNRDIEVVIRKPRVSVDHLELYNAYHQDMTRRRGWPLSLTSRDDYIESFVVGAGSFAREFLYYQDERLVGVGLVDVLPEALSSIYFFHDPDWRPRGPGTFSALTEISFARALDLPFVYLGYWIAENSSMDYKARFRPHQILERYPADHETPRWDDADTRDQPFSV